MDERMFSFTSGPVRIQSSIRCQEIRHREQFSMPTHCHTQAHFALVFSGLVECSYGHRDHFVTPSTFAYTPPGWEHSCNYVTPVHAFYISMDEDAVQLFGGSHICRPFEVAEGPITAIGHQLHHEYAINDLCSGFVVEETLLELFSMLTGFREINERSALPKWITLAIEILHSAPTSLPSVTELAGRVGVHPGHLMRTFRKSFGCSIGAYSRQMRIAGVCRLLRQSPSLSLGAAALEFGFPDQQYFSNYFKKFTGLTPTHFLQSIRSCPQLAKT